MIQRHGLHLEPHRFQLPLDHADPAGPTIEVFAREVRATSTDAAALPWLVFLQGGPGFEAPRPLDGGGWIGEAVKRFRVLLLDQRGTGCSTPFSTASLARVGDAAARARTLTHLRADSIVRDCEAIRRALGVERWTVLGQSFGGFCAVHYLSSAPEGLAAALITGGLPGLEASAEDVYRLTYGRVRAKNERLHRGSPELRERVVRVFERVRRGEVSLPCGDPLSLRRLQTLGLSLGFSYGAAQLGYLFERAFVPGTDELSRAFLRAVENAHSFDTNPGYVLLHEPCYAQGAATAWAAERIRAEFPEFDAEAALDRSGVPLFTGEMVYPWFLEEMLELRPLAGVANLLAAKADWPSLYDTEVLARNEVPVAAAVYHDDMFVPAELSLETARRIQGLECWVTNEYEHDGLRADGATVFDKLIRRLAR